MVTIKEPNAIEPSERVEARTNDESVGCFGWRGSRCFAQLRFP